MRSVEAVRSTWECDFTTLKLHPLPLGLPPSLSQSHTTKSYHWFAASVVWQVIPSCSSVCVWKQANISAGQFQVYWKQNETETWEIRSPLSKSNLETDKGNINKPKHKHNIRLMTCADWHKPKFFLRESKLISAYHYQLAPPDYIIPLHPRSVVVPHREAEAWQSALISHAKTRHILVCVCKMTKNMSKLWYTELSSRCPRENIIQNKNN